MEHGCAQSGAGRQPSRIGLTLTGRFELFVTGNRLDIPHSAERVLAFLALASRPVARSRVAGVLWLDGSEQNAAKSLRTALWRLNRSGAHVLSARDDPLRLGRDVAVDVAELEAQAIALVHGPDPDGLARLPRLVEAGELLPDWDEEWVVADRERYRVLRLEALERGAIALLEAGHLGEALFAALAAIESDPLRESARRLVVQVQLARGNTAEAIRTYREYRSLLQQELGIEPSRAMEQMVAPFRHAAVTA
jgi:DNA-binding SARP family transcriptional activator